VTYLAGIARVISSRTSSRRNRDKFAAVFPGLRLIPVVLVVIGSVEAKVPSVALVAALVLVLWFYSTGAVIGAMVDRAREAGSAEQQGKKTHG
jgi:hypothetical protein